jgi:hypothetical protein
MPTHRLPHQLLVVMTTVSHFVMIGGAIALYLAGKLSAPAFVAIMAGFGGAWSGVAGVIVTTGRANAVTPPAGTTSAPVASATPTTSSASPVEHPA